MRFILYARASTKDKQQPDHQLAELQQQARVRGWTIAGEVIERESGRKDDRPLWNAALDRVLRGEADGIAAVELSRFGRSLPHLLQVSGALEAARRHLVCTRQPIDTTTPVGKLVFSILGAVAAFEADLTRERVRAGVRHARDKRGGAWGRPRSAVPARTVAAAATLKAAGMSWRRIAARLFAAGEGQPARMRGGVVRPARPWPAGTLQDAVEKPAENAAPNPAPAAGSAGAGQDVAKQV